MELSILLIAFALLVRWLARLHAKRRLGIRAEALAAQAGSVETAIAAAERSFEEAADAFRGGPSSTVAHGESEGEEPPLDPQTVIALQTFLSSVEKDRSALQQDMMRRWRAFHAALARFQDEGIADPLGRAAAELVLLQAFPTKLRALQARIAPPVQEEQASLYESFVLRHRRHLEARLAEADRTFDRFAAAGYVVPEEERAALRAELVAFDGLTAGFVPSEGASAEEAAKRALAAIDDRLKVIRACWRDFCRVEAELAAVRRELDDPNGPLLALAAAGYRFAAGGPDRILSRLRGELDALQALHRGPSQPFCWHDERLRALRYALREEENRHATAFAFFRRRAVLRQELVRAIFRFQSCCEAVKRHQAFMGGRSSVAGEFAMWLATADCLLEWAKPFARTSFAAFAARPDSLADEAVIQSVFKEYKAITQSFQRMDEEAARFLGPRGLPLFLPAATA